MADSGNIYNIVFGTVRQLLSIVSLNYFDNKRSLKFYNKANLPVHPYAFRRVSYKLHYKAGGSSDV